MARIGSNVRRKVTSCVVTRVDGAGTRGERFDELVTEEPLEIRVESPTQQPTTVAVTMRTPGHDFELATGFLFTEMLFRQVNDVRSVRYCELPLDEQQFNVVTVTLAKSFDEALSRRAMITSASCGICGTASIQQLELLVSTEMTNELFVDQSVLVNIPEIIRKNQPTFDKTGGLHAAGLVDGRGLVYCVREDIGRHNAVDKVIGRSVLDNIRCREMVLMVSGRVSFEIIQKAAVAEIPFIAAVGAPSSLAVETADKFGITLVGFIRGSTANVYTHSYRVTNLDNLRPQLPS